MLNIEVSDLHYWEIPQTFFMRHFFKNGFYLNGLKWICSTECADFVIFYCRIIKNYIMVYLERCTLLTLMYSIITRLLTVTEEESGNGHGIALRSGIELRGTFRSVTSASPDWAIVTNALLRWKFRAYVCMCDYVFNLRKLTCSSNFDRSRLVIMFRTLIGSSPLCNSTFFYS